MKPNYQYEFPDFPDLGVAIPDGVIWHIEDYDGLEHIAEDHRTWG